MSKTYAKFPFTYISKSYLGKIRRPYAICEFKNTNNNIWIPIEMVVDTGADYTVLPINYANLLGIDINKTYHRYLVD